MQIEISNLSMTYPSGKTALEDMSLQMKSPSLIGLLGPNGAGKSTLMKLLVAALLPTEGRILVDGLPLERQEQTFKARLGYLPQSFGLFDELTVWQFLDYMAALKKIPHSREAIARALGRTNLEDQQKARIRTLSGGQRQRVGIAQAILGNPELLIFDEPTVGLDPEERISFRNLFSQIAQERLVLLSTHIIEDIQSVCNQLLVIHEGQIRFSGVPGELIAMAEGYVGVFRERDPRQEAGLQITSRIHTAEGVICRAVAKHLPDFAKRVEPTLEDAYLYLISREVMS